MKLSTKGRYSIRALIDLALHPDEGPILIRDIAKRQRISERYLEQLFIPLRVAGLVRGIQGAHGGFILIKPPAEIRLSEVIRATEGSTAPVNCVDEPRLCLQSSTCPTRYIWAKIKRAIDKVLESTTLQDLAEKQRQQSTKNYKTERNSQ